MSKESREASHHLLRLWMSAQGMLPLHRAKHEDKVHDIWLSRVENNPYARPDTNSVRLPDPVVATKALAASRSLSTLFSLTNRHVSYLFSFHLLNVHMSSDIVRLPDHCWAAFQLAFAKTGEMGRGVNELFFYLQLFEDRVRPNTLPEASDGTDCLTFCSRACPGALSLVAATLARSASSRHSNSKLSVLSKS